MIEAIYTDFYVPGFPLNYLSKDHENIIYKSQKKFLDCVLNYKNNNTSPDNRVKYIFSKYCYNNL